MTKNIKIALIVLGFSAAVTAGVILFKKKKKVTQATAITDGKVVTVELNPVQSAILTEAERWVGVKEIGDNATFDNKNFVKKMVAAGWQENKKIPYCATFVRMVLIEISKDKAKNYFKKNTSLAALTTWQNLSKGSEYAEKIAKPEPACLVCYEHHTEFLMSTDGKTNTVVSANSKFTDGTQGVVKRTRPFGAGIDDDPLLGYIRIKKLL